MSHTPARPTRRILLAGAAATAAAAVTGTAAGAAHAAAARPTPARRSPARTPKALLIGLDGCMLDRVAEADAPHLHRLIAGGLRAPGTIPYAFTLSGPGWSTLATGVWPTKHGVRDNTFRGQRFATYPDVLTRVEHARPALRTYAVSSWPQLTSATGGGPLFSPAVDVRVAPPGSAYDAGTTQDAVARLSQADAPDASFVQLDNIDHAGHASGGASRAYLEAIAGADAQVGQMLTAITTRPTHAAEDWLIMVTADHGHTDAGGHGGTSAREKQTFVIAHGAGFAPGSTGASRMVDVAPTLLTHLGIAIDPRWHLDGAPLR
ncbi:alkaline phosphatase family protein [Streptomyces buecherae]|uniref:Alkaline phosphatase family protein n=1 Tax=Streptomyces buecherae TaxID=2763006 RepID=A0A7H8N6M8_9ACTN|nr:alkaline phosphatase family protein [Streptomyces buecherae]QKW50081.1 alkaline phosphatase family protein [Streptomyces buecherae]